MQIVVSDLHPNSLSTYFVALLEALSLHSCLSIGVHSDARCVLWSKNIVNFADELLVLGPDHTGEQGNTVALHHADDLPLADVRHLGNDVETLGRTSVVATA